MVSATSDAIAVSGMTIAGAGQKVLLDRVNFRIAKGERVGLIGESGSGKSLTAAALCGLLRAPLALSEGSLKLNGAEMRTASARQWRSVRGRQIFQVFQSPASALTPARRIGGQLAETCDIAGVSVAAIGGALEKVGLAQSVTRQFPYQLSGGMKQRILIAMALLLRPAVLIADEPTTGLDVLTEGDVLAALRQMVEETGAAMLFISHDLRAVRAVADRVLVMDAGQVVEDCSQEALSISSAPAARRLAEAAQTLETSC